MAGLFDCCFRGTEEECLDNHTSKASSNGERSGSTEQDRDLAGTLSGSMLGASQMDSGLLSFTLGDLKKLTRNFDPSHKIGQGGFGIVYKGQLPGGKLVAIKRARKDMFKARSSQEFHNEITMLASVEHLNLVKLIGYMEADEERILVEEFIPNGNMRQHLDCNSGKVLDLFTRLDILIDVAHALSYLHLYADKPIIHRDVKASNILLTENFRAKVADFGFSRVGPMDSGKTHVSTKIKGTAGYLDPEYLKSYKLTVKSDVYSFGILLLEVLTGRRPIEQQRSTLERITVRWAYQKYVEGKIMDLLDPKLEKTPVAEALMKRTVDLAFICVAPRKEERPAMNRVAQDLWNIRKDMLECYLPERISKNTSSVAF